MSTGMNFTCISAFDASKDIIWSFSYKFESNSGNLENCGFTTFLNFLSAQTKGGINSGLGYGPYNNGVDVYEPADENFLAIALENSGMFGLKGNGFSTGLTRPVLNSISVRKNNNFEHVSTKDVDFNIVSSKWQTLRFQLTNLGHTLNVFYCDEDFNYKKIATFETSDIFYISQQLYIGISFATPINNSTDFKLRIKNFHFYGQTPNILPPVIVEQTQEEFLFGTSSALLSTKIIGARPLTFAWFKDNALITDETNTSYDAVNIGTYKLRAHNSAGYSFSKNINVLQGTIPTFDLNLNNNYIIPAGRSSVVLKVSATSAPNPSYRWYKNNQIIKNAKTSSLTAYDIANYMAVAYNRFGEVSSLETSVSALIPTLSPSPISGGAPFTINANALGSLPINYQWYKNGVLIGGETNNYFVAEESGLYTVKATNAGGYNISYPITSFNAPTFISKMLGGLVGDPLEADVSGSAPITYSWYRNDTLIINTLNNNYTPTITGSYKVVATNMVGSITSEEVVIQNTLPVQILSFIAPECIDVTVPINVAKNVYKIVFDRNVKLYNEKINKLFESNSLSCVNIKAISPDINGYSKNFEIYVKKTSDVVSIIDNGISTMIPKNTLTCVVSSKNGKPLDLKASGLEDVITPGLIPITLPWGFYPPGYSRGFNDVGISYYSNLIFGTCTVASHHTPIVSAWWHPILLMNFNNKTRNGLYGIYKGEYMDPLMGKAFVLRWEGVYEKTAGIGYSSIDTIWEFIIYKDSPTTFTIKTDNTKWNPAGITNIAGGSIIKPANFPSTLDAKGKYFTFDSGPSFSLPPNICYDITGSTNIKPSKQVFAKLCLT